MQRRMQVAGGYVHLEVHAQAVPANLICRFVFLAQVRSKEEQINQQQAQISEQTQHLGLKQREVRAQV